MPCRLLEQSRLLELVKDSLVVLMLILGAALPLVTILIGKMTNLFGGISSPGALGIPIVSQEYFDQQIRKCVLVLIYIGISVLVASYIGTVFWIIAGERITRRIRM